MIVFDTNYGQANGMYVDMNKLHDVNPLCLRKPASIVMLDRTGTMSMCK